MIPFDQVGHSLVGSVLCAQIYYTCGYYETVERKMQVVLASILKTRRKILRGNPYDSA